MSKYNFVHLHNHTEYSLLDGMIKIEPMVLKAKELGMNAVAITDHGNLYGIIEFYQICRKNNIKPIIGSEFYMTNLSRFEKKGSRHHLILLAKSEAGYKNLIKLSSLSFIEGFYYKPRIDKDILEKYHEGLVCLSGCLQGEIPTLITEGKLEEAERCALYFKELFGNDSFFLEMQIHGIKEELNVAKNLYSMSKKLMIPLAATNDAHYLDKEDTEAHDALLCIGTKKHLNDSGRMRFNGEEFYFKSEEEMEAIFKDIPKALSNTQFIAEMCELSLNLPGPQLPEFEVPEGFSKETFLKEITAEGLKTRYDNIDGQLLERINHEIDVINRMGFSGYFLIVWDFIKFAKRSNIWVGPGRGSGAGSIVAYSLGITNIDPIKYGLIFERFLNEQRISMPDFDIDFCKERRQEVIEYVTQKYSKEKVSQIVTFSKMNAKAVIRDVGRVIEVPLVRVNEIVDMLPEGKDLKREIFDVQELKKIFESGTAEEKKMLEISVKLEGISRHTSMHAAGVVIGQKPITEYVPLQIVKDDRDNDIITTQFPGPQLEDCGLVKMDFLGLITLTLMRNCLELLEKKGILIDLDRLDIEDPKVFELFARGETNAIFQFESPGMKKFLKKLKPTSIDDLIAMNALYRPGPMNFIDTYIARKHGLEKIEYDHPLMEQILNETYGITIYQEQVMKIAQVLAGYNLGNADILRSAMGKKKISLLREHEKIFIDGCEKNGINTKLAEKIFRKMEEFGKYGFNKSHSTAYAIIAYQCAYLKTYHTAEFMAAVLTSEIGKPDKIAEYLNDIKEQGIRILPPDVNFSDVIFIVEEGNIRYALPGIKGVGETASLNIKIEREKEGRFNDFFHFLKTVDLRIINKAVLEILIKTGSLDSFGQKRKWMMEHLDELIAEAQSIQADKKIGQGLLFDTVNGSGNFQESNIPGVDTEEWNKKSLLMMEKELLGFYVSGHPLESASTFMRYSCTHSSKSIKNGNLTVNKFNSKIPVTMAGTLEKIKIFTNENGGNWAILSFEDFDGMFTVYLYKKEYEEYKNFCIKNKAILIKGSLIENNKEERVIITQSLHDLEKSQHESLSEFHVYIGNTILNNNSLEVLKNEFSGMEGKLSLIFHINDNGREIMIKSMNIKAPKDLSLCDDLPRRYDFIDKVKIV